MEYKDFFHHLSPDNFKDEAYETAVKEYPAGSLVCLKVNGQIGAVGEVKPRADGPAIKVNGIGLVPIGELMAVSDEDIERSRFKDDVMKIDGRYFFKK